MTSPTLKGLQGLETVLRNLNREVNKIEGRTLKGLIRGAIVIRRSMSNAPPYIPIDEGNLRAGFFIVTSAGITTEGGNPSFSGDQAAERFSDHSEALSAASALAINTGQPAVIIGFSAGYAVWVHEMIGATFKKEGAGPKFLEAHVKRSIAEVFRVIGEEAKIR